MDSQEGDSEEKVIVRSPSAVQREQQAWQPDYVALARQRLDDDARIIAKQLVKGGRQNQGVNSNHEFQARVDLRHFDNHPTEPLRQIVEAMVKGLLDDDVELLVKVFDARSSYTGLEEVYDITMWASPRVTD